MRKYTEALKIEYKPAYFKEVELDFDSKKTKLYRYNNLYWEKDWKEKNWDRL